MQIREISIEEWRRLIGDGVKLAVNIPLNGNSMMPLVRRQRDRVTVVPVYRAPRRGDIVLFQRADGVFVVHRLLSIGEDTVRTLGDNCRAPDPPIPASSVLGIVTYVQRGKRMLHVDTALGRFAGRIWSVMLPVRNWTRACWRAVRRVGRVLLGRGGK